MTETRKNDNLNLLEKFDVNVPLTVEIIYESDNDEKNDNEIKNNENNQDKELDDILSGIIRDIAKASDKSNQVDHASSKNSRPADESCPEKRAKANNNIDGYRIQIVEQLNVEYRENTQNDQFVSRKEVEQTSINNQALYTTQSSNVNRSQANHQCATYNQHNIQSQQFTTNTTWQDTINSTRLCSVNNSHTENTRQTSESNTKERSFISSLSNQNSANNSIHPSTSLSKMNDSQSQIDLHLKASECVGKLLSAISSHLVLVMKAWTEYMHVYKSPNKTSCAVDIAYKQYRETKYHFFYLSFVSVNNTLLPKENDHVFIKKFIEYTLGIARSRNVYVTYQDIRTVLNELFDWVKSNRYPLLNKLLRPPAELQQQQGKHINNRSKEHQGWQCDSTNNAGNVRLSSELPGRDSAINVINGNSSAIGTIQPIQNVNTPEQSLTYYETLMQHRRPEPQSLANHSSYVEEFQAFTRQDNQGLTRGTNDDPKKKKKRGPRQKKNHPVVSVLEVQARTLPPPYEDSISVQSNYSDNQVISLANNDSFQPQNQACEVNRSLSRDSGFVSPRSPANDLDYSSVVMTPFITHVTSLNPSATQIKDGVCLVCGTATKQMCRGCYKAYYCSNLCQSVLAEQTSAAAVTLYKFTYKLFVNIH